MQPNKPLLLTAPVKAFALLVSSLSGLPGTYHGDFYARLISKELCQICYRPFGVDVAKTAVAQEDTARDGRQMAGRFFDKGRSHVSDGYRFTCPGCGHRYVFRQTDHKVILLPKESGIH